MKSQHCVIVALALVASVAVAAWAQSPTAPDKGAAETSKTALYSGETQVGVVDAIDGPFLVVAWYDRQGFTNAIKAGGGITDAIVTKTRHVPLASIISVERPGQPDPAQMRGVVFYKGPFGRTEEALIVDLLANPDDALPDDDLAAHVLDRWSLWLTQNGQ